jgi:hypothetical protein
MKRNILLLFVLLLTVSELIPLLHAEIQVVVKKGDWIEYKFTYNKTPPTTYTTWLRIDVVSVQEPKVIFDITRKFSNGTEETDRETVNLQTGELGDGFFIPANLSVGDTFMEPEGKLTVGGTQESDYAGETRTILYTTTLAEIWWDQVTGILVEVRFSQTGYSTVIEVDRTSLWGLSFWNSLDSTVLYVLIIIVLLVITSLAIVFTLRRKRASK